MSARVALYAEGAGETLGAVTLLPTPGDLLREGHLGPAHLLVRRVVSQERRIPEDAVHFVAPLRSPRGKTVCGSMLHSGKILRKCLVWPFADRRPDLAVVIVDQDDETRRKRDLDAATANLAVTRVIAVAVKEFEAWLLADPDALRDAVGPIESLPAAPEGLPCRAAKKLLAELEARWVSGHNGRDELAFRRTIAAACSLAAVANRCPSFSAFLDEVRTG
jgi:hypothetical protein